MNGTSRKIGVIVAEKIGLKQFSNIDIIGMTEVDGLPGDMTVDQRKDQMREEVKWVEEIILGEEREKVISAFAE